MAEWKNKFYDKANETKDKRIPEMHLWRSVLYFAIADALGDQKFNRTYNTVSQILHREYFLNPSEDFYIVCENAGMDPEYVKRKVTRKIRQIQFIEKLNKGVNYANN